MNLIVQFKHLKSICSIAKIHARIIKINYLSINIKQMDVNLLNLIVIEGKI